MGALRNMADLAEAAKKNVGEIDADELKTAAPGSVIVLDVREPEERMRGAIPGSVNIPRGLLEGAIERKLFGGEAKEEDLDKPIVVHCAHGLRSLLAAQSLKEMGFRNVTSLRGGIHAWAEAGGAIEAPRKPA